jgi:hypothetical protein
MKLAREHKLWAPYYELLSILLLPNLPRSSVRTLQQISRYNFTILRSESQFEPIEVQRKSERSIGYETWLQTFVVVICIVL